ncbi:MAG: peptide chain release factor N(5)-glutamine methyltransferase [bacterium]|nr:peptide chain release factor N(5)-glutamine methyltransferase [bacterium]
MSSPTTTLENGTRKATTAGDLVAWGRRQLAAAHFDAPAREAVLLLARILGRSEASIRARDEETVPAEAMARYRELLVRRTGGEPVAYLFGEREFYGRAFAVDSRVLIPRPETEHLIEAVLALDLPPRPLLLDAGTGSGCIAVTLALELPGARVVATDMSSPALRVAASNVRRHGVTGRVALIRTDLTDALRLGAFDAVASNPPYVDRRELAALSPEVKDFEPHEALFAPGKGHSVVERLLDETAALSAGTHLVIEIGYDQSEWLEAAVVARPAWSLEELIRDYGSIPRTAVLRRLPT